MPTHNRAILFIALLLFLAVGAVTYYLFIQNLTIQSRHERAFLGLLHQTSVQNHRLSALYQHGAPVHNFDRMVKKAQQLERSLLQLQKQAAQLKDDSLEEAYTALRADHHQKMAILERLKALGAVHNNSFRYLYELYESLSSELDGGPQGAAIRLEMTRFMAEASLGSLDRYDSLELAPLLREHDGLQPDSATLMTLFLLHAQTLLEATEQRRALMADREALAFGAQIEQLYDRAQGLFAQRHRNWMVMGHIAFGAGLLFFVAFLAAFIQEERLKKRLVALNADLQRRVEAAVASQRQQEQILIQQSKLAAMGEMIGAIAHQWRQPLNALSITIQDLEDAWAHGEVDEPYIRDLVRRSVGQINHMSETINDFRNFFKESKEQTRFNLTTAILETTALVEKQYNSHNIAISLAGSTQSTPAPETLFIRGYLNEFKQAVLNILGNAKDAITARRLREKAPQLAGEVVMTLELTPTEVVLGIEDNGGGIEIEPIERVFEPYFSTKEEGQGSGIGLYMAKVIIETNMHGRLRVENRADGARFEVRLKRSEDEG